MNHPPLKTRLKVVKGYLILTLAWALFVLWLPLALITKVAGYAAQALSNLSDVAEKDMAAVKAWKSWRDLPQSQMYLSIYYSLPESERMSEDAVRAKIEKLQHWSQQEGSPLAHWTDEMWHQTAISVWFEFDMQQKAKQHRETGGIV